MGKKEKDIEQRNNEEKDIEQNDTGQSSGRAKKPARKGGRIIRMFLCVLQHIFLGTAVIALLIVVSGSTIHVNGLNTRMSFHMFHQNRGISYEDSDMFNSIFGYMIADIIRYGVVSSQLETDGAFDGSKVIDVTAFNYRDRGLPEHYVTADYRLDDLLKWANYGFEWTTAEMTQSQADSFLAPQTKVTVVDRDSQYYNTSDAGYLKSDIETYTYVNDVSANQLWEVSDGDYTGFVDGYEEDVTVSYSDGPVEIAVSEAADDGSAGTYDIMVNRYKTTENKNLEEYVSDWDLYYDLCNNVQNAANSLVHNYNEYQQYNEYYGYDNTNVRYMIMKTVGDQTQFYSNLNDQKTLEDVGEYMRTNGGDPVLAQQWGKYIFYNPEDMVYKTNTAIAEGTVRNLLQNYDYAYPESVKVWISVDTTYPVDDAFRQGWEGFRNYLPSFWQLLALALVSGVIYFVLLCYLSVTAGSQVDADGKRTVCLRPFDRIPTEPAVLIAAGAAVLAVGIVFILTELFDIDPTNIITSDLYLKKWFLALMFVLIFAADSVFVFFFFSLIRRIKARVLWKNSWLRGLMNRAKEFVWNVYDNGHVVLRTWVPYGILLAANFILLFAALAGDGAIRVIGLVLLIAFDIFVGSLIYRNAREQQEIVDGIEKISGGQLEYQVKTEALHGYNLILADSVNSIGNGIKEAVEISMKDERMKADLITNVSHDIKTPLTSIINYVDLIKREQVNDEKIRSYIQVLDEKSQRLKQLTDDLVEASKISSGNISLNFEKINLVELMNQTIGEFSEKFDAKRLTAVMNVNVQNSVIEADSRRMWRVMENLFNNIYKYAMEGTRVYLTIDHLPDMTGCIRVSVKNISAAPLNCSPDELTERFIRGDESRTTEGSGLGLSIAKNLTEAQKGTFRIELDADLFTVTLTFPLADR